MLLISFCGIQSALHEVFTNLLYYTCMLTLTFSHTFDKEAARFFDPKSNHQNPQDQASSKAMFKYPADVRDWHRL